MHLYNLYFLKAALKGHVIEKSTVNSLIECGLKCASLLPDCKSLNYITKHPGQSAICEINNSSKSHADKDDFVRLINSEYFEPVTEENQHEIQDVKKVINSRVFLFKSSRSFAKKLMSFMSFYFILGFRIIFYFGAWFVLGWVHSYHIASLAF